MSVTSRLLALIAAAALTATTFVLPAYARPVPVAQTLVAEQGR